MTFKIAVYGIVKNESAVICRWYDTAREADAIYVTDTGSSDDTEKTLLRIAEEDPELNVFSAVFLPFRFDLARNFALTQVPDSIDYAVFLDADEVLEPGWYRKLQDVLNEHADVDAVNLRMIYTEDDSGNPGYTYNRLMVHKPSAYKWHYPAHEVLLPLRACKEAYSDIMVYHRPVEEKAPSEYMELLKLSYDENKDARSAYYYARELYQAERYEEAVAVGYKSYTLQTNYLQRLESASLLGYCYENMGNYERAKVWFTCCCMEAPDVRESWYHAASFYMRNNRYHAALGCIENMEDVKDMPKHSIIRHDNLYREVPSHLKALCLEQLGWREAAKRHIQHAFNMNPKNRALVLDLLRILDIDVTTTPLSGTPTC